MNTKKAKIFLINNELTVAEMARQLVNESNANEESLKVMITDMINGRRLYPTLANQVEEKFGLKLERPAHLKPLPHRQAA